jgi:prephenate dehydratase
MFFVDLAGASGDEALAAALAALGGHCESVRLLGTYRSG